MGVVARRQACIQINTVLITLCECPAFFLSCAPPAARAGTHHSPHYLSRHPPTTTRLREETHLHSVATRRGVYDATHVLSCCMLHVDDREPRTAPRGKAGSRSVLCVGGGGSAAICSPSLRPAMLFARCAICTSYFILYLVTTTRRSGVEVRTRIENWVHEDKL
jgi:hypothetical protein